MEHEDFTLWPARLEPLNTAAHAKSCCRIQFYTQSETPTDEYTQNTHTDKCLVFTCGMVAKPFTLSLTLQPPVAGSTLTGLV